MTKPSERLRTKTQAGRYASPWSKSQLIYAVLWHVVWFCLFRPTPKVPSFFVTWRLLLLRCFGCRITGRPFVAPSMIVKYPWQLEIEDRACIGPHAEIYNLGHVIVRSKAVIAQHVYVCGGTHDFNSPTMELMVGDIEIGADVFVGAKALILPGVVIGAGTVIGAGSVVTKDIPEWTYAAGNPCRVIRQRDRTPHHLPQSTPA